MAFEMPILCCGQSTIQFKCLLQDTVFWFGWKRCRFNGTFSISSVKDLNNKKKKIHLLLRSVYRHVRIIVKSNWYLRHVSSSVRIEQLSYYWTNFHETLYLSIFRKSVSKFKFHKYQTRITDTLHANQCIFLIISHSYLVIMRNVSKL
jgi:hypothetical protein